MILSYGVPRLLVSFETSYWCRDSLCRVVCNGNPSFTFDFLRITGQRRDTRRRDARRRFASVVKNVISTCTFAIFAKSGGQASRHSASVGSVVCNGIPGITFDLKGILCWHWDNRRRDARWRMANVV
jgi:hypothetical protein